MSGTGNLLSERWYDGIVMNKEGAEPGDEGIKGPDRRRRGRRPADARERRAAVERALRDLEAARVPFSMGDLAERAGISRATLYRDVALRDLIGAQGDSPPARPVDARKYDELKTKVDTLTREQRRLKALLRHAENRAEEATKRAASAEELNEKRKEPPRDRPPNHEEAERIRRDSYADGFAAGTRATGQRGGGGGRAGGDLLMVASRLPRASLINARKALARALHPDLYQNDPAAALLATELLKQINALVGSIS